MGDVIGYAVLFACNGVIWGIACNRIIRNRGYCENWFWWGFFFSLPAALVALSMPLEEYSEEEETQVSKLLREIQEKETLKNGAWKCGDCGQINSSYVGICACGKVKPEAKPEEQSLLETQEKELLKNGAWRCSECG